ncbi:MAG: type II toxin-antitoxin system VapC family toxin [Candidatus Korarchaeum sp.]|nr:type II toxin-antitoxin system VapC family toxin [Candidatus Korarchaeum sp.]MDW8036187.1 type II toxin-antitoxin system VapC family toxin [Candidatus Korarchaeum sp.]
MDLEVARVTLDSDVLVDFLRGRNAAVGLVEKLLKEGVCLATTAVNVFELAWGAYKVGRINDIEELVEVLVVLNLTGKEAMRAGEEIAYLSSLGLMIDIRDLLIGIIARENGYALLTGNTKHFTKIRGLKVIEYRTEPPRPSEQL